MASTVYRAAHVGEITTGGLDYAGNEIACLYAYNPPDYAVYRTSARVMVHFADDHAIAGAQRARLACLTPLRGQVSSLINGWHTARDRWWLPWARENPLRKKAVRYDRRTADSVVLGLDNVGSDAISTAQELLAEIKDDIISERTSMARSDYLRFALLVVILLMIATGVFSRATVQEWLLFPSAMPAVWTSVSGGALGAFFSIAIGLKSRGILIDLQNRDNRGDALLRMLIGVIAGGMILCLLLSGLISSVIDVDQLTPGVQKYKPLLVFVIGFLAGFFERLVPDLLSQTNLGTKEKDSASGTGTAATRPPSGGPSGEDARETGPDTPPPSEDSAAADVPSGSPRPPSLS